MTINGRYKRIQDGDSIALAILGKLLNISLFHPNPTGLVNGNLRHVEEDFRIVFGKPFCDQSGRSYGQRPNSIVMDWRPGGGPVVQESIAEGQTKLVYSPLDGTEAQVFTSLESNLFREGRWSGNGSFFIYSTVDEAESKSYLYLWQPDSDAPTLLRSAEGTDGFRNFSWLPDSTGAYFNLDRVELWKYEVETESLILIASSKEN